MPAASRASESTSSSVWSGVADSDAGVSAAFRSPGDASGGAFGAEFIAPASVEKPDGPGVAAATGPVGPPGVGTSVGAGRATAAGLGAGSAAGPGVAPGAPDAEVTTGWTVAAPAGPARVLGAVLSRVLPSAPPPALPASPGTATGAPVEAVVAAC